MNKIKRLRENPVSVMLFVGGLVLLLTAFLGFISDNKWWPLTLCLAGYFFWIGRRKWDQLGS